MNKYPAERKEALLRQMMPPQNKVVSELARESGTTEQTLYTWRRQLRNQGTPVPGSGKNAEEWTSEDKFAVVLETAALNAAELAEYCRRKGLALQSGAPTTTSATALQRYSPRSTSPPAKSLASYIADTAAASSSSSYAPLWLLSHLIWISIS